MKLDDRIHDFTAGAILPQLVAYIIPLMLANCLQAAYTLADIAIVGHFAGSNVLAAVSVSGQITIFLTLVSSCLSSGAQVFVAQLLGQKRRNELTRVIGCSVLFTLLCGVGIALLGVGISTKALAWLNTPAEAYGDAVEYFRVCCVGMVFLFGYNAVCAVLRGMGQSKAPTVFIAVSAAVNVVGDILLVAVFRMGALGAALATAASQLVAFLTALVYLRRICDKNSFRFGWDTLKLNGSDLRVIVKLAFPLVMMQVAIHLSMMFVTSYINAYGVAAASLAGIGDKLCSLMSIVSSAAGVAMATITGQNIGAGKPERVSKALFISTAMTMGFFVLILLAAFLCPKAFFSLFTEDADILGMAPRYLHIALITYLTFALINPVFGIMNGVGDTNWNLVFSLMDGVVARIGLSLFLGKTYGLWGYIWGYNLAGIVSILLGWGYYATGHWKHRRLL